MFNVLGQYIVCLCKYHFDTLHSLTFVTQIKSFYVGFETITSYRKPAAQLFFEHNH